MTQKKSSKNQAVSGQSSIRWRLVLLIFLLGSLPLGKAILERMDNPEFWWLAILTIVCSLFGIRLPLKQQSGAVTVTISDVFIFLTLFLYGVDAAILVGVVDAITVCLKVCWRSGQKLLFNIGQMSLAIYASGSIFWLAQEGQSRLVIDWSTLLPITVSILACAVLYYACSSLMIGLVIAAGGGLSIRALFADHLIRLSPTTILSVLAATAVLLPITGLTRSLLALFLLATSYLWPERRRVWHDIPKSSGRGWRCAESVPPGQRRLSVSSFGPKPS